MKIFKKYIDDKKNIQEFLRYDDGDFVEDKKEIKTKDKKKH